MLDVSLESASSRTAPPRRRPGPNWGTAITKGGSDPMAFIVGRELYGSLEKIVDRFEDVANEIQGLVIDHA